MMDVYVLLSNKGQKHERKMSMLIRKNGQIKNRIRSMKE